MHIQLKMWMLKRELANERRVNIALMAMVLALFAVICVGSAGCGIEDIPASAPIASATGDGMGCEKAPEGAPMVDPHTVSSFTETVRDTTYVVPLAFDLVGACEFDGELTYATFLFERTAGDGRTEPMDICSVFQCGGAPQVSIWLYEVSSVGLHGLNMMGPGLQGPVITGTPTYGTPGGNGVYDRIPLRARTPLKLRLRGPLRSDAPPGEYRFVIADLKDGTMGDPRPILNVPLTGPTFSIE